MIYKKIKCLLVLLLAFQLVVPAPLLAAAVGQFTSVMGDVTVSRAGVRIKPAVKMPVHTKDLIVTGDRSTVTLLLEDDSTISLSSNSRFEVREFNVRGKTRRGLFSMTIGRLTAEVKKFIGGNSSFEVHSPTAVAGVRGTGFEFVVAMVGPQLTTTVTCTAGAMSVSAISATGAVVATSTIVAGQTAVISAGGITVSAATVGAAGAGAAGTGTGTGAAGTAGTTAGATGAGAGAAGTTGAAAGTAGATAGATTGAAGAGAAGAGAAGAGAGAAAGVGAGAGVGAAAGIGAGTIAAATAVTAVAVTAAVEAGKGSSTTTHH